MSLLTDRITNTEHALNEILEALTKKVEHGKLSEVVDEYETDLDLLRDRVRNLEKRIQMLRNLISRIQAERDLPGGNS
jgi:uncharacterized small protein (DUF1192 family)